MPLKYRLVTIGACLSIVGTHFILNILGLLNFVVICIFMLSVLLMFQIAIEINRPRIERVNKAIEVSVPIALSMKERVSSFIHRKLEQFGLKRYDQNGNQLAIKPVSSHLGLIAHYIPESVAQFASEWSIFDMLCMIFVIKGWVMDMVSVISTFMYSSDPREAQIMLLHMRADYKNQDYEDEHGANLHHVKLSEHAHAALF